jgi:hypothetical protein
MTLAPKCFGSHRNHHQEAVLCLAKTTSVVLVALVGIDVVNVMAAYQLVVQACGSRWRKEMQILSPLRTTRLHNRLICRHNIDWVYTDEQSTTIFVVLAKHRTAP